MADTPAEIGDDLSRRVLRALEAAPEEGPLTLYLSSSSTLGNDLTIPARCALMFAPGVRVTLEHGMTLWVHGAVDLGFEPRFELRKGASVKLLGLLEEIRPEWWFGDDASASLDAAVLIAVDRMTAGVAQAPIRLCGPYELSRTLDLGALARDQAMEFVLLGRHPRGDSVLRPTFLHHPESVGEFPLLRTSGGIRVSAEHVGFDTTVARMGAPSTAPAALHQDAMGGTRYHRCSFWGAAAVRIEPGAPESDSAPDMPDVTFDGCWFEGVSRDGVAGAMLSVAEGQPADLHVSCCAFMGSARALIEMSVGALDVQGCVFDNVVGSYGDGCDLLLNVGISSRGEVSKGGANLALNELHVRTRSLRHVRAERDVSTLGATVCMTGVVQDTSEIDADRASEFSSVSWRGPLSSSMVIQGCFLEGTIDVDDSLGIVSLATTLRGVPLVSRATRIRWSYPPIVSVT
ncbi:MAG: hypothetical protein R3A48_23195 [Polyangiales bacterium]